MGLGADDRARRRGRGRRPARPDARPGPRVGIAATPELEPAVRGDLAVLREALAPWATGREYLNFAEVPGGEPSRHWDAATYARLRAVKADVDPENVIVSNHPIG